MDDQLVFAAVQKAAMEFDEMVTRGSTGMTPAEFKKTLGVEDPNTSAQSLMGKAALAQATAWKFIIAQTMKSAPSVEEGLADVKEKIERFQKCAKILNQFDAGHRKHS